MVDPPKDLPTPESVTPEAIRVREELARGEGPMLRLGEDDQKKMEELVAAADELKKDTDPDAFQALVGQVEDLAKRVNLAMQMAGQTPKPEPRLQFADASLPDGTGVAQVLFWDNTDKKWVLVAAPAAPSTTDYALMFDHSAAHGAQVVWVEVDTFACP